MGFEIDQNLPWHEHYVEHGFCVVKRAVDLDFCRRGIETLQRALRTTLPPTQWTTATLDAQHAGGRIAVDDAALQAYMGSVYDQPGIEAIITTMFGSMERWSGQRDTEMFLAVFDPDNPRTLAPQGHVDFVEVRIPVIGNGFVFQTSLIDTEPFSGNITIYPGWHKVLQKQILADPAFWYGNRDPYHTAFHKVVPQVEPYEFVAEAGDVLLMHHLVGHAGNCNAATNHTPRVAIHAQLSADVWPNAIDADDVALCPWLRSLAHNGSIHLGYNEQQVQADAYRERAQRPNKPA